MPGSIFRVAVESGGAGYSQSVGFIYVFNLIVGTGALTMPRAFSDAGWLVSLIVVTLLAFTSYLTVTFVIEAMAAANAVLKHRASVAMRKRLLHSACTGVVLLALICFVLISQYYKEESIDDDELAPLVRPENLFLTELFEITEKVELGEMAGLFFNKAGVYLFYTCMIVYLYGDLAVYGAAVPKSLRDIICTYRAGNISDCGNKTLSDFDFCFAETELTRQDVYRILVAVFGLLLGPFAFFNVQKTKYLQIFTTVLRWLAFSTMVVLAVIRLARGKGQGTPPVADISGVPTLFGVCVYSFMCHHSLPSLVTPIGNKSKIHSLFAIDYLMILVFYSLLSFTGIFTFKDVQDLFTLNFEPDPCSESSNPITNYVFIQYFLALFPVFTLSTNFPIIAITLRNNLIALFRRDTPYPFIVRRFFFPLLAILPPLGVAIALSNLGILVGITGSYAGAGIQYVIPALLVLCSRKSSFTLFENNIKNSHTSPFKHRFWIFLVLIWAGACVVLVTVNHILTKS